MSDIGIIDICLLIQLNIHELIFLHAHLLCFIDYSSKYAPNGQRVSMKWIFLTLTVLGATINAQWEGMGDVGSARYEPALLPPCPTIRVLSYSN